MPLARKAGNAARIRLPASAKYCCGNGRIGE
jgi:hypothetical protein